jgi:hypothetical protein
MLKHITRNRLIGCWFAAVALFAATVIALGVNVGVSTSALLLTLSLAPPGILLALWRGTPPSTIGDVLYATSGRTESRP